MTIPTITPRRIKIRNPPSVLPNTLPVMDSPSQGGRAVFISNTKLCPKCFKIFKHSKEGKIQRKRSLNKLPASWGKGQWPKELYHNGKNKLCPFHNTEHLRSVKKSYEDRDLIIKSMGFKNYNDYLSSALWNNIRQIVIRTFNGKCQFCNNSVTEIHHSSYDKETLLGHKYDNLHPVCNKCHHKMEYFDNGEKTHIKQSLARMR